MNTMTYQGFVARIEFDERDDIFVGRVLGLPDRIRISFEGDTVAALRQDFEHAIDFYLRECEERGEAPIKPPSGNMMLRVPPEVHGAALMAAQASGQSLNQWAARALAEAARASGADVQPI